ncbi:response regulator [Methyloversatilis thermotolerans]|uniref:response regulator n=1 Tax=Methyloversatilis thermotolerans TaxID=1346290 RepID=UPI0003639155|nr:response regulator [Methyloversatilis thermotolerans]
MSTAVNQAQPFTLPILLVEDNPVDIDLTCRAFARSQMNNPIAVARDGEEALGCIARWEQGQEPPPSLILLDINLPRVNGIEVLRHLKSHPRYRRIPVVVLTSSSEDRDLRDAYSLGVNSFIVKPVDFDRFVEAAGQIERYWCELNQHPL